jgi:lipooligosaccharide transport system ATP-binding protein
MTESAATPLVHAQDLRKEYGALTAVDGVTFSIRRGECFGLLGPNGAGKTTTIRMLYGFTPRTSGALELFGTNCDGSWRTIKARIGVCQQDNTLDPDLTVAQNLKVFGGYFNLSKTELQKRIDNLLRFAALDNRRDADVRGLSGGMVRRLILARALINEPELLILDEPTTGLDPQSRHQLWSRLEDLKARGLTTLLTTHYMDEAERLCDRLVIMDQGRILVEGAPGDLIHAHVGRTVIEIMTPGENIRALLKERSVAFEDLGHRLIVYHRDGEELYRELIANECREGCMLRPATLEDVFLRLTGRDLRE